MCMCVPLVFCFCISFLSQNGTVFRVDFVYYSLLAKISSCCWFHLFSLGKCYCFCELYGVPPPSTCMPFAPVSSSFLAVHSPFFYPLPFASSLQLFRSVLALKSSSACSCLFWRAKSDSFGKLYIFYLSGLFFLGCSMMDSFTGSVMGSFDEPLALDEHTYAGRREVLFFFVLGALCVPPLFFLPLDPGDRTAVAIPIRAVLYARQAARFTIFSVLSFIHHYVNLFTIFAVLRHARHFTAWFFTFLVVKS